jgi:hypothetical protein
MTEEPKIQHIDSIPAQREEAHVERLPGDLVCRLSDPKRTGRVEQVHFDNECTVRWLDSDTLEILPVKDLKKIGEAEDETPKTFAELKPPGYWSKAFGFVEVHKREWDHPSGKITIMKAPTQCALWKKPELIDEPNDRDRFELLGDLRR